MKNSKIEITSIQSRPNFLPFTMVMGRNDTSPKVSLSRDSVLIRVFFSNQVPYNTIRNIEVERGLQKNHYAVISSVSWDYIVHPKTPDDLEKLLRQFKAQDVPLGSEAESFLSDLRA